MIERLRRWAKRLGEWWIGSWEESQRRNAPARRLGGSRTRDEFGRAYEDQPQQVALREAARRTAELRERARRLRLTLPLVLLLLAGCSTVSVEGNSPDLGSYKASATRVMQQLNFQLARTGVDGEGLTTSYTSSPDAGMVQALVAALLELAKRREMPARLEASDGP